MAIKGTTYRSRHKRWLPAPLRKNRYQDPRGRRSNKYGATRCECTAYTELAGRSFPSKLERSVARDLVILQRAGIISSLELQPKIILTDANISWRVDFSYIEDDVTWYHEAKGDEDRGYKIKKKLWTVYGPGPLRITKGTERKHGVVETITPQPKGKK